MSFETKFSYRLRLGDICDIYHIVQGLMGYVRGVALTIRRICQDFCARVAAV